MTVRLDSEKTAELSVQKTSRIDYGHAIHGSQSVRAERITATGDQLSQRDLQGVSPKAELAMSRSAQPIENPRTSEAERSRRLSHSNSRQCSAMITASHCNASWAAHQRFAS